MKPQIYIWKLAMPLVQDLFHKNNYISKASKFPFAFTYLAYRVKFIASILLQSLLFL